MSGPSRRELLRGAATAGAAWLAGPLLGFGRCRLGASEAPVVSSVAVDVVLGTTVVDMLGLLTLDWPKLERWRNRPASFGEGEFRLLERGGIDVFHPAVETNADDPREAALRWTTGWNRLLDGSECWLARVDSPAALDRRPGAGPLGVIVGFQNSDHFRDAADVETFARLGQRVSQLTYNGRNRLGSGCFAPRDGGLTPFGAAIVGAMNRAGMAVDLSHCGERTTLDAIAESRLPVLVTHANCRALVPGQPRCKSDAVLRALAAGGGVIGITSVRAFVGEGRPSLDDLLDHFEHVARLVGVEHVGIGSDVDPAAGGGTTGRASAFYAIRGLDPAARVFQIADGLLRRGWAPRQVALVLGGNFRRALGEIWSARDSAGGGPRPRDPFCPAPHPSPPGTIEVLPGTNDGATGS